MPRFTTANGSVVTVNPKHVFATEPAKDDKGRPMIGLVGILLPIGAIVVKGAHDEIDAALGLTKETVTPDGEPTKPRDLLLA